MEQQIVVSPAGSIDSHGWKKSLISLGKVLAATGLAWLIANGAGLPWGNMVWLWMIISPLLTVAQNYFFPQTYVVNQ